MVSYLTWIFLPYRLIVTKPLWWLSNMMTNSRKAPSVDFRYVLHIHILIISVMLFSLLSVHLSSFRTKLRCISCSIIVKFFLPCFLTSSVQHYTLLCMGKEEFESWIFHFPAQACSAVYFALLIWILNLPAF